MAELLETVLERAIVAVQRGALDHRTMAWTFAASDVTVLSATAPADDLRTVAPLVVQREGQDFLAVFTTPGRSADWTTDFPFATIRVGLDLLQSLPSGVGVVVNPGSAVGFEMGADGIARLLAELSGDPQTS